MIIHVFNSSLVSGPERLVLPALAEAPGRFMIVNLVEQRLERLRAEDPLETLCRSLGLRYAAVPIRSRWDPQALRDLRELFEREKPELVHAHADKASLYVMLAVRKMAARPPIVSTHHGVRVVFDWKTKLYEKMFRYVFLRFFDRVVCVSTPDFETVRASGISPARLRLHLNGIDETKVDPARRAAERGAVRAAWLPAEPAPADLFLFGVVARLSPEKGHERLLRTLALLHKDGGARDWRLLIFGGGRSEQELRETSRALGLERRVVWMGYRSGVGRELPALDLMMSFSKAEGLPINLLEAGWAGIPVMSTLVGGVNDLIPDARFGIGIPPGEPVEETARRLKELLTPAGEAALAAQGRNLQERVATEFSRARWLSRLREIYAELGAAV